MAPTSSRSACRCPSTIAVRSASSCRALSRFESGYAASSCAEMMSISERAAASVASGASRPTSSQLWYRRVSGSELPGQGGSYRYADEPGNRYLTLNSAGTLYRFVCLTLPPLTARHLCRTMTAMFIVAPALGLGSALAGFVLANAFDYPLGQFVVAVQAAFLALAWAWRRLRPR